MGTHRLTHKHRHTPRLTHTNTLGHTQVYASTHRFTHKHTQVHPGIHRHTQTHTQTPRHPCTHSGCLIPRSALPTSWKAHRPSLHRLREHRAGRARPGKEQRITSACALPVSDGPRDGFPGFPGCHARCFAAGFPGPRHRSGSPLLDSCAPPGRCGLWLCSVSPRCDRSGS